ncbi:MAG: nucleotide exchange factor GrpE [Bacteroidota bacterium]
MIDKKHEPQAEDNEERPAQAIETAEEGARAEVEALKRQLEDAEARAARNLDGWQRAQAEFVNYKNRVQRDQDTVRTVMKGDILKRVLPVLDDLERALANRPKHDAWASGLELITRKFQTILEAEGLTRIEAEGQPFDPNFHEAISHEPSDEAESGRVIAVVQNGYMLGDRVIRPAMVRVAQ